MHELGLAWNILEIVGQAVPSGRAGDVRDVRVRVGESAGVVADSLAFCFDAIVIGTPWRSARLAIERVPDGADLQVVDVELDDGLEGLAS
jgi:hydrogenase nickel incorporation protein HypA/HybF